jgi:hypothetical protein
VSTSTTRASSYHNSDAICFGDRSLNRNTAHKDPHSTAAESESVISGAHRAHDQLEYKSEVSRGFVRAMAKERGQVPFVTEGDEVLWETDSPIACWG